MRNRWVIALAGTISMMCLGAIYSWSIFTQPLIASFGWSNTTTTWAFAFAIFFLGVGAVVGGRWQDRAGPRRTRGSTERCRGAGRAHGSNV
jgi:OFA family oxalate/formate antiporter-like MFS transporter